MPANCRASWLVRMLVLVRGMASMTSQRSGSCHFAKPPCDSNCASSSSAVPWTPGVNAKFERSASASSAS